MFPIAVRAHFAEQFSAIPGSISLCLTKRRQTTLITPWPEYARAQGGKIMENDKRAPPSSGVSPEARPPGRREWDPDTRHLERREWDPGNYGGLGQEAGPGRKAPGETGLHDPDPQADSRILADVRAILAGADGTDAGEITVRLQGGEITLEGRVPSMVAKQAAGQKASGCKGVNYVQNNLEIRPPRQTPG